MTDEGVLLPFGLAIASSGQPEELKRLLYTSHRRLKKAGGYSLAKKATSRRGGQPTTPSQTMSDSKDSDPPVFPAARAIEMLIVAGGVKGDIAACEELFWGGRKVRLRCYSRARCGRGCACTRDCCTLLSCMRLSS
jgi:hypothetical protein